jgi:hypothetical protein
MNARDSQASMGDDGQSQDTSLNGSGHSGNRYTFLPPRPLSAVSLDHSGGSAADHV